MTYSAARDYYSSASRYQRERDARRADAHAMARFALWWADAVSDLAEVCEEGENQEWTVHVFEAREAFAPAEYYKVGTLASVDDSALVFAKDTDGTRVRVPWADPASYHAMRIDFEIDPLEKRILINRRFAY